MSCIQVKGMRKGNCKREFIQAIEHILHDRGHIFKGLEVQCTTQELSIDTTFADYFLFRDLAIFSHSLSYYH